MHMHVSRHNCSSIRRDCGNGSQSKLHVRCMVFDVCPGLGSAARARSHGFHPVARRLAAIMISREVPQVKEQLGASSFLTQMHLDSMVVPAPGISEAIESTLHWQCDFVCGSQRSECRVWSNESRWNEDVERKQNPPHTCSAFLHYSRCILCNKHSFD